MSSWSAMALSAALLCLGCKSGETTRTADVELDAVRATLGCSGQPAGEAAEACRIVSEFGAAGEFNRWPSSGVDSWFGRTYCSSPTPGTVKFARLHLRPGAGTVPAGPKKPDPAQVLRYGVERPMHNVSTAVVGEWEPLLAAVKAGVAPSLDRPLDRSHWESIKQPATPEGFFVVVRTSGPSFAGGSGPLQYFARGVAERVLVVQPGGGAPCASELWRVP